MKKHMIILCCLVLLLGLGLSLYVSSRTKSLVEDYYKDLATTPLWLNMQAISDDKALLKEGQQTFIALDLIEAYMPKAYRLAPSKKRILFSNDGVVYDGISQEIKAPLKAGDFEFNLPVLKSDDRYYLSINHLEPLLRLKLIETSMGMFVFSDPGGVNTTYLKKQTPLKMNTSWYSLQLRRAQDQEKVWVVGQVDHSLKVITDQGEIVYVDTRHVDEVYKMNLAGMATRLLKPQERYGYTLYNFDHVTTYRETLEASNQDRVVGKHVVMPTVFKLTQRGWVLNNMDHAYVDAAHARGYQVHAVFDNDFDPDLTETMLTDPILVKRVIDQLVAYALYYNLDGINLDFENVYLNQQADYTAFVKALKTRMQPLGRQVSVDVTVPGGSEQWSLFADRESLGRQVDFMVLMAYDEHWASSPVAGPVASMPWTEKGIQAMLDLVSKDKLVLGVPSYMRVWTTSEEAVLRADALSMVNLEAFLADYNVYQTYDAVNQVTYYEMENDKDQVLKIWAEDQWSVKARANLVKKYQLAGLANWRRGFEPTEFWLWVTQTLNE